MQQTQNNITKEEIKSETTGKGKGRKNTNRFSINPKENFKQKNILFDDFGWEVFEQIQAELIKKFGFKLNKVQVFCFLVKYYIEHQGEE